MDPRTHDPGKLVETAARALFERRAEHTGLRFDALPIWALWVRESYLADARTVLEAAGVLTDHRRSKGDRYERLADAALSASTRLPTGAAARLVASRDPVRAAEQVKAPRTEELEALLLEPADVAALGRSGVASSLDWDPPTRGWNASTSPL